MKKIRILLFTLLFVSILAIGCSVNAATAATETTTTSTGDKVTWSYNLNSSDQITDLVCTNLDAITGVVTIPSTLDGKTVKTIGKNAFVNCVTITGVKFNSNIISIGDYAFAGCVSITSIDLSTSKITTIGTGAFNGCTGMKTLNLGTSLAKISKEAFEGCSGLKTVEMPNTVSYLGESAFENCSGINNLKISESLTILPEHCFKNCTGLTEVKIPESVTTIKGAPSVVNGYGTFLGCKELKKVLIPSNVSTIEEYAFQKCENITIYGEKGSTAETFANEHKIPFDVIENWNAGTEGNDVTAPVVNTVKVVINNVNNYFQEATSDYRIPTGLEIKFLVAFSENVTGEKMPNLKIKIGNGKEIELTNGISTSGTSVMYTYVVKDTDSGLIDMVSLAGGDLKDKAGNEAELKLPEKLLVDTATYTTKRVYVDNEKIGSTGTEEGDKNNNQGSSNQGSNNQGTTGTDKEDNKGTAQDKQDGTTAPGKIPQTGESVVLIATILVIFGVVTILFVKNKQYKDIK